MYKTDSFVLNKETEEIYRDILRARGITQFHPWPRSVFAAIKKLLNKFTRSGKHRLCSVHRFDKGYYR